MGLSAHASCTCERFFLLKKATDKENRGMELFMVSAGMTHFARVPLKELFRRVSFDDNNDKERENRQIYCN